MREMKDSGVEWIGEIPASWQLLTVGSLFRVRNEKVNDTDYPPLSVTKGGIVPQWRTWLNPMQMIIAKWYSNMILLSIPAQTENNPAVYHQWMVPSL